MSPLHAYLAFCGLAVAGAALATPPALATPDPLAAADPLAAFFERHCLDCHSGPKPEAGLDLSALPRDLTDPKTMRMMVRIHDRVARGEMPPADAERPPAEDVAAVTRLLDSRLFAADSARIEKTGRARMRRMTVREFENTLRDLLALERLEIRDMFPDDARVAGFTKIADGLDLSPVLLETFAAAAEKALTEAIATRSEPPPVFKRRFHPTSMTGFNGTLVDEWAVLIKDGQWDAIQPLTTEKREHPPGTKMDDIRADNGARREARKAQYKELGIWERPSTVGLLGHPTGGVGGGVGWGVNTIFPGRYRVRCSVWAFTWDKGRIEPVATPQAATLWAADTYGQSIDRPVLQMTALSLTPKEYETTAWLDAQESVVIDPVSVHSRRLQYHRQKGGFLPDYVGPGVAIDWYEVEGPIFESWPPESHRRLFGDLPITALPKDSRVVPPRRTFTYTQDGRSVPMPAKDFPAGEMKRPLETVQSSDPLADARRLLGGFLPRALRRPVAAEAVEPYVAIVKSRLDDGECFEDAMKRAYVAILTSPDFLYHPADTKCDQYSLASRLSYWLWNSPPDGELLAAAQAGSLADPKVLHAQVDRLLDDPKSDRFIEDFTNQWLALWRIDETTPDRELYPEFTLPLEGDMLAETRGFVRELIARNLPARNLVDSEFTLLNQRLAELYGVPGIDGVTMRRVTLPAESIRGGLLTQASILKLTANGTVTSPVKRGVWVMDRLLDDPPPPPPANVPAIDPDTRGATTIREQLALHSNHAACAVCHAKIDPAGFALEAFDVMGGHRDRYRSTTKGDPAPEAVRERWLARYRLALPVDSSGRMPDGRSFADVRGLKTLLAEDARPLARAFAAHMTRYATGADLSYADRRTIDAIVESTAGTQYGIRSLIHAIAAERLPAGIADEPPAVPPNIIFILADDIGYGDLACYGAASHRTPHCDRLAREGVRFTDGHAPSAVCTPTRYAFLTGEYAWRQPGTGILPGNAGLIIAPGRTTVASMLKRAGYATGVVGKWHLGLGTTPTDYNAELTPGPLDIGFDEAWLLPATGDRTPCVWVENRRVVGLDPADPIRLDGSVQRGEPRSFVSGIPRIGEQKGGAAALWKDNEIADVIAAKGVAFIEKHRDEHFFLYLATHDIHVPRVPHARFKGTSGTGVRGDTVHSFDWTVGQILDTLDRLRLAENTLVILTSDNGGILDNNGPDVEHGVGSPTANAGHSPNGPLRGHKGSVYEGGTRVPFLVRWPARIAPASSDALVSHVDMLATLASLVDQPLGDADGPDSIDVLPALLDAKPGRDHLVEHGHGLALRMGQWKYVPPHPARDGRQEPARQAATGGSAAELYDLAADIGETRNVAADHPDIVARMAALLAHIEHRRGPFGDAR